MSPAAAYLDMPVKRAVMIETMTAMATLGDGESVDVMVDTVTGPAMCSMITGLQPQEHAATRNGLYVSDLEGKIWIFDLILDN